VNAVSTVPLGSLMAAKSGSVNPAKCPAEVFDLYSIPAFDRGEPDIVVGSAIGSSKQIVRPGDVLLSRIVPHIRRAWVVGRNRGRRIIASGEWIVFRNDKVHPAYLRHVLVGDPFHAQFMSTVAGVGGSLLRARPSHVANITVPLPDLPEQRRVANILDLADALRVKGRAALDSIDSLTGSVFTNLFGNSTTNSKGFPVATLGDVATFVGGGTPSRAVPEYFTGSTCWATSKDIKGRFLDDTQEHVTAAAVEASATKVVPAGTILVVVKSKVLMHRLPVAITRVETCFGQDIKGIVVDETCLPTYVATSLRMNATWLLKRARGINTEGLTLDHLRRFPILLPSQSMQHDFACVADQQEMLRQRISASIEKLNTLFASLQHRAFRGEL
jgi:type I restriction enzyme S subunit